jgi:cytochrome b
MRIVDTTEVPVWDPLVRLFHWTLFISFCAAWFTEAIATAVIARDAVQAEAWRAAATALAGDAGNR